MSQVNDESLYPTSITLPLVGWLFNVKRVLIQLYSRPEQVFKQYIM
jgi:hypothetical protein